MAAKAGSWIIALGVLTLVLLRAPPAAFGAEPRETVAADLEAILEGFTGRQLAAREIEAVTAEFLALYPDTACETRCRKALDWNLDGIAQIRRAPRAPQASLLRDQFIATTYFNPRQRGSLIQRLFAEPDPIAVIDRKSTQVMTEADVRALVALWAFANGAGPPQARPLSAAELRKTADGLQALVGSAPGQADAHLPALWAAADAVWIGLVAAYPRLSAAEREAVRAYVRRPVVSGGQLAAPILAQLFEVGAADADRLRTRLVWAAHRANMHRIRTNAIAAARMTLGQSATIAGIEQALMGR